MGRRLWLLGARDHAPATGLAVSELIADGHAHTLEMNGFRHDRFGENLAVEGNIF